MHRAYELAEVLEALPGVAKIECQVQRLSKKWAEHKYSGTRTRHTDLFVDERLPLVHGVLALVDRVVPGPRGRLQPNKDHR